MKTLHRIISEYAKNGTKVPGMSRRDIAKVRRGGYKPSTMLLTMMDHPRAHESKCYWPTRDTTFILEEERRVRDERHDDHPMITLRNKQYPVAKVQGKRTR